MSAFLNGNSVYSDSTFGLFVLFHACHVYRGLDASLSLIAFANSKYSDEPVLKRSQRLFCYNHKVWKYM